MHDIVTIEELRKQFNEKTKAKDLKEFAHSQQLLIEELMLKNKRLEEKVAAAESLLLSLQRPSGLVEPLAPEEMVCIEQIDVLRGKSAQRELSLDEVKKLDILVKNLRVIRGTTPDAVDVTDYNHIKEADLVRIATSSSESGS